MKVGRNIEIAISAGLILLSLIGFFVGRNPIRIYLFIVFPSLIKSGIWGAKTSCKN